MADNENLDNNVNTSTPNVVADQGKEFAKKQAKKSVAKAAGNAVKSWLLPILPWIIGIAIALIIVAGIIMFFISGIGLVFESIKTAAENLGHKVQAWWYGQQYIVSMQEVVDVADQLETMGYDLLGDGFLTGVIEENDKVAKGLDRKVPEENASVDASGVSRDEKGIVNIDSDYIRQYIVSDNYMYTIYNTNGNIFNKSGFIKLFNDGNIVGNKGKLYESPHSALEILSTNLFKLFFEDNIEIQVNTKDKTLEIAHVKGIFWWKKVNTFKYNLEGWTGRYGMPLEFLLSLHLASMQPDLAYDLTTEFQTSVNMLLHPVDCTIIGHIHIDGIDISSDNPMSREEWNERKNIKPGVEYPEGEMPTPNGFDTHDYDTVISDLNKVKDNFPMYYPYIGDVTNHWFRDAYMVIEDYNLKYIKNDQEFEYYTGERWTDYETETDADGNEHYVLYLVDSDGELGSKYNGTTEQAREEGVKVSKKAKTGTIEEKDSSEFTPEGRWTAYDVENNAVLIAETEITPDVVGESDYNSMTYRDEITYEAITSELLKQVRDGERSETNSKIKKMLTQYSYYTYNGQRERALSIMEDKERVEKELNGEYKHEDAYGIIDGTPRDPRDQNLVGKFSINADSLSAFKILENMNTIDADEIYRDFKELIVELNYFDKEYFAGNATDVFQWPINDCGTAGWPVREFEKPINTYGTLINSRINLLNLKNLFLQYRQEEEEVGNNTEQTNQTPIVPKEQTNENNTTDGATKDREGNATVDTDGYLTDEGKKALEDEKKYREERRKKEGYDPEESKKEQENLEEQEGIPGESEKHEAGPNGAVDPDSITEDFINAEEECGALGWIDTFDIVMDNLGYNARHRDYDVGSEKSYLRFMRGLGGVFAEYAGDENNGEGTYEDFMAGCQYVFGLGTMFGFEYCNFDPEKDDPYQWAQHNENASESKNDAYYESNVGMDHNSLYGRGATCGGCDYRLMDDTMIEGRYCTNCNFTTDKVYYKAGLFDEGDSSCAWGSLIEKYHGNYVHNVEELQVGDLLEQWDDGVWVHVSFVGEINDDEIVVYETGHSWLDDGSFRHKYDIYNCHNNPTRHQEWVGVHLFDLEPKRRDNYNGYPGNVDVVSPITGEIIDAGEVTITNIQTNELETVGYVKIRALTAEDIGTCIPDTDISNMENPKTVVPRLKVGSNAEKEEYYYGGYKLFLQEYQNAKVNGYILYMEGFDLRLVEKGADGKIRLRKDEKAESILDRDGKARDRYVMKYYRDVIGEDTRIVLKNKQRLRKAAEPLIEVNGRIFVKEGTTLGRTYTDGIYDDKPIRDEDTAVVRPCLEKRISENATPIISKDFSTAKLRVSEGELEQLMPNEYPTGNYMRLILRTAEDGATDKDSGNAGAEKDNIVEDCEDYIEIDKIEATYNTLKFLYIGGDDIYYNDLGGQLASLAQKAHQNIIAVCAYDPSGLGSVINDEDCKTIYWNAQKDSIALSRKNMAFGEALSEDWGNIEQKGKWDYIMVSGGSEDTIREVFEKVQRSLKDPKNFIILSKDNNPQSYSNIAQELKCSVLGAGVIWNDYSDQSLLTVSGQPSGVKQYMTACSLFAKFYGTGDLTSFIPLFNTESGNTKDFYREAEYYDGGGGGNKCSVTRARADEIQSLVVKHYEDGVLAIN